MSVEIKRSFCRICHAACPVDVHIDTSGSTHSGAKQRVIKVTGVDEDPIFNGYTCIKGRQLPDQIHDPACLLYTSPSPRDRG